MKIVPVLLAGGIGERFWPASRSTLPKQLLTIAGDKTLLEQTVDRVASFCQDDVRPLIVTGARIADRIRESFPQTPFDMIAEPIGKNTAPAVGAAAAWIKYKYGDAIMAVLSADHVIRPVQSFIAALTHAAAIAEDGERLVVFGITPTRAETGYGHIEIGTRLESRENTAAFEVNRFVEKPDLEKAREYTASGTYLWNSGMFVWKTSTILDEFARYMPELHTGCMQLVEQQCSPSAMDRFYRERRKESIDYGIMEKSDRVAVIRGDFEWDDVGSWEAMSRLHPPATEGTTVVGERVFDTDCSDTIIVNKSDKYIAALGLEDITVVATDDALLVIPRSKLPDIKKYLGEMKSSGRFPEHLF